MTSRILLLMLFGAVSWLPAEAAADGEILTAGAVIEAGSGSPPGVVVIDADAPAAEAPAVPSRPPLGGVGDFTQPLPPFPAGGTGTTPLTIEGDVVLPGGVYRVSRFEVAAGASVVFDGNTVVRAAGPVSIRGDVRTSLADSLRILGSRDVTIGAGASVDARRTLVIEAGETFFAGEGSRLTASGDGVTVRAHGRHGSSGDVVLQGAGLQGSGLTVQAAGSVTLSDAAHLKVVSGAVLVAAHGGDVEILGGAGIRMTSTRPWLRVEAAGSIALSGTDTEVRANGDAIRMRALGGALSITDGASVGLNSGEIDLGARGTLRVEGDRAVGLTVGAVRLRSFGEDVVAVTHVDEGVVAGTVADLSLEAARDVAISGPGWLGVNDGLVRFVAHGGDVLLSNRITTFGGVLHAFAWGDVLASGSGSRHDGVVLAAETGRIDVLATHEIRGGAGGITMVSGGDTRVRGAATADGPVAIASIDGAVDVAGAVVASRAAFPQDLPTGAVTLASHAGDAGSIDATGAIVRSGASDVASGDVTLVVHAGRIFPTEEGQLIPERVVVRRRRRRPDRSVILVRGTLDEGWSDLAPGPAVVTVGSVAVPVHLSPGPGMRLTDRVDGLRVVVRRDRRGGSRGRFRLRLRGPVTDSLTAGGDGPLVVEFDADTVDAQTVVDVADDRFRRSDSDAMSVGAGLVPERLDIELAGQRALSLGVAVAELRERPPSAPDVHVTIGAGLDVAIPADAFSASGDQAFVAVDPIPGVSRVELDYASGSLWLEALDVSTSAEGQPIDQRVLIEVRTGAVTRGVRVRPSQTRHLLRY